ncbi:unnamed protein product [Mytilus edulis]|uniref:N-acetyltransferase domain-containing protein n=1 Tax=Mytilus edulis TaxID=6550 RepID=A0A8S3S349_MYTED|nr:unnamed protein product [Mytilus edulis]
MQSCVMPSFMTITSTLKRNMELSANKEAMIDSDKTEIKRVSLTDYDDVISIRSAVHGGFDYLPYKFKSLITQSHNEGYATIINGKFVAFCIVSKVDGGATVVTRASRVHKQYEGLGLYKALTLFLQKHVFSDGTVTNDAVVYNDNNQSMLDKTSKGELTLLMKRNVIGYKIDSDKMTNITQMPLTSENTRILYEVDLISAFKSRSVCSSLFPEERIICHFVPYRLTERNIPLIFSEVSLIVGTGEPELSFITCGTYYRSENGHTYILEVYGNCSYMRDHLVLHFKHALQYCPTEIDILIMCKENDAEKINNEIKEFQLGYMVVDFKTVFLVEKNIKNTYVMTDPVMIDSEQREVRRVNDADYDDVVSIRSSVYDGYDYLPFQFKSLINHPDNEGYATIVNGQFTFKRKKNLRFLDGNYYNIFYPDLVGGYEIFTLVYKCQVAFCMVSKVDGGETMVTRAGRINKQFEGHGIYKALKSFIKQRQCNGTVCNHAYIATDTNQMISAAISRGELAVLEKKNTVFYKPEHDLRALIEVMDSPKYSRIMSPEDMEDVFQSNDTCIKLFPEARIMCNIVPYRLKKSNIPLIFSDLTLIVGTYDSEWQLITCGSYSKCEKGHVYELYVYGYSCFMSEHVTIHLKNILKYCNSELELLLHYNEKQAKAFDTEMKKCQFIELNGSWKSEYLLESKLK